MNAAERFDIKATRIWRGKSPRVRVTFPDGHAVELGGARAGRAAGAVVGRENSKANFSVVGLRKTMAAARSEVKRLVAPTFTTKGVTIAKDGWVEAYAIPVVEAQTKADAHPAKAVVTTAAKADAPNKYACGHCVCGDHARCWGPCLCDDVEHEPTGDVLARLAHAARPNLAIDHAVQLYLATQNPIPPGGKPMAKTNGNGGGSKPEAPPARNDVTDDGGQDKIPAKATAKKAGTSKADAEASEPTTTGHEQESSEMATATAKKATKAPARKAGTAKKAAPAKATKAPAKKAAAAKYTDPRWANRKDMGAKVSDTELVAWFRKYLTAHKDATRLEALEAFRAAGKAAGFNRVNRLLDGAKLPNRSAR